MAIPPFPARDLAKLVLGYLAEEQMMIAYDEVLHTSPYLDDFSNEYDRILMEPLKNILAEYRAVKIYVESCTPHLLRRKLLQCSNLLELFKYLIDNIDLKRLTAQENTTARTSVRQSYFRSNTGCDICNSLNLVACGCTQVQRSVSTIHPSQIESNYGSSAETPSLDDLPGNSNNRNNKNFKNEVLNENILLNSHMVKEQAGAGVIHNAINTTYEPHLSIVVNEDKPHQHINTQDVSTVNSDESTESDEDDSDSSANNLQIVQEDDDAEEIEMNECVEGNENFMTGQFDEAKSVLKTDIPELKDKFSIEICIDDDKSISLKSTNFKTLLTEMAGSSISDFDKLYTPMKDQRSQSTQTSIDTLIKNETKEVYETEVNEIVLEVESIEEKEIRETKKRKRITSEVAEESVSKKTKPETQFT